jgi:hypothetical protein
MAGIGRRGLRPAPLVAQAFKTGVVGGRRTYSYIYIHLNF